MLLHHAINLEQQVKSLIKDIDDILKIFTLAPYKNFVSRKKMEINRISDYLGCIKQICQIMVNKGRILKNDTKYKLAGDTFFFMQTSSLVNQIKEAALSKRRTTPALDATLNHMVSNLETYFNIEQEFPAFLIMRDQYAMLYLPYNLQLYGDRKLEEHEIRELEGFRFIKIMEFKNTQVIHIASPYFYCMPVLDRSRVFNHQILAHELAHRKIKSIGTVYASSKFSEELLADLIATAVCGPCYVHCFINHISAPTKKTYKPFSKYHPHVLVRVLFCISLLEKMKFKKVLGVNIYKKIMDDALIWRKAAKIPKKKYTELQKQVDYADKMFNIKALMGKFNKWGIKSLKTKDFSKWKDYIEHLKKEEKQFDKDCPKENYPKNLAVVLNLAWLSKLSLRRKTNKTEYKQVKEKVDNIATNTLRIMDHISKSI